MLHKSDSNYQEGVTFSEPTHMSNPQTVLFSLLTNTYFSTFRFYVETHFYTTDGPGPSLATVPGGLVVRIQCFHCCGPTSISDQEQKSCFKPLQVKAS